MGKAGLEAVGKAGKVAAPAVTAIKKSADTLAAGVSKAAKATKRAGNPQLGGLMRSVAKMPVAASEKVKLLSAGAAKLNVAFKRMDDIPGAAGLFKGQPDADGLTPILVVLNDGRILRGVLQRNLIKDPSGKTGGLRILLNNMVEL